MLVNLLQANQHEDCLQTKYKIKEYMKFRPCIDLHQGKVKQIVGSSLSDKDDSAMIENFSSSKPASWFAELYKNDELTGGHIIRLGPDNDDAAIDALTAWKGGMQLGGGITADNAEYWLEKGASSVIVTSYIFSEGHIHEDRLQRLAENVGKNKLVLDLSCRLRDGQYWIVTDRWQKFTDVVVDENSLDYFARYCHEFLIHAVDVEGKCRGIEQALVELLGNWGKIPITYAGGIASQGDIELIKMMGRNKLDFTVGSALDIFGGSNLKYQEMLQYS